MAFHRRAARRTIPMAVFAQAFPTGNAQVEQLTSGSNRILPSAGNAATGFTAQGDRCGTAGLPAGK